MSSSEVVIELLKKTVKNAQDVLDSGNSIDRDGFEDLLKLKEVKSSLGEARQELTNELDVFMCRKTQSELESDQQTDICLTQFQALNQEEKEIVFLYFHLLSIGYKILKMDNRAVKSELMLKLLNRLNLLE